PNPNTLSLLLLHMKDMKKPHPVDPISPTSKLSMDKDSHMISKFKPKIRIIHIYAPEIIKTDVANFRELVQRLTGKPADHNDCGCSYRSKRKTTPRHTNLMALYPEPTMNMEVENQLLGLQNGVMRIKNEENYETWRTSTTSNEKLFSGFFDGFSDLDGFIEELSDFPMLH
ncbi:VQ motif protein, partial [Quillaja saponaria]